MRKSGILLHISSLPSKYGIGSLGQSAYDFVRFLKMTKCSVWQVLPIGQTGYGDSPYQSVSSFAGNPYFIDLDVLVEDNLLEKKDLPCGYKEGESVDYGKVYFERYKTLRKSFDFSYEKLQNDVEAFKSQNDWLEDYALFMALKDKFDGKSWYEWTDEKVRLRDEDTLKGYEKELKEEIEFYSYIQFLFYKQWTALRQFANENEIKICGDMPIYCAPDSADVWANSKNFQLDENRRPTKVAGVPPDYFCSTGQLWGNPLFDWDYLKEHNYEFWIKRMKAMAVFFDMVRLDHFIGFENYYSIDASATTAMVGVWEKGPSNFLFDMIQKTVPELEIIAEDLGLVSENVIKLKDRYNFAGMHVLSFMISPDQSLEENLEKVGKNSIMYTGTHDNDTIIGLYESLNENERINLEKQTSLKEGQNIADRFVEICLESQSNLAIIPIVDFLKQDANSRMNTPGVAMGNWRYSIEKDKLNENLAKRIATLNIKHNRTN